MYTRTDVEMARLVNRGIEIDLLKGAATAWAYMKYGRVPQQVILRVLAEPTLRRVIELTVPLENDNDDTNAEVHKHLIHLWRSSSA